MTTEEKPSDAAPDVGGIAADQLRNFVERIERLNDQRRALADDIAEVFAQAKANGYDVGVIRIILRERRMDPGDVSDRDTLLDVYRHALGMAATTE